MDSTDRKTFVETLEGLYSILGKPMPNDRGIDMFFRQLERFPIHSVVAAIESHTSSFPPTPSEIAHRIEGGAITPDEIIAAARLAETPLGCLARIKIGTWDLGNQDAWYLRQRAEEVIQKLPEWRSRHASGELSDHEIKVMLKYGLKPWYPFHVGCSLPPRNELLGERTVRIAKSKDYQNFIGKPVNQNPVKNISGPIDPKVAAHIAQISTRIPSDKATDQETHSIDNRCKKHACVNTQHANKAYQIPDVGRVCGQCFRKYSLTTVAVEVAKQPIIEIPKENQPCKPTTKPTNQSEIQQGDTEAVSSSNTPQTSSVS